MLGSLLLLLGASAILGLLLKRPFLTQMLPGYIGMVASTACGFVLMGFAVLGQYSAARAKRRRASLAALAVLLLALLNIVQLATGIDLGVNLPALHAWLDDGNPKRGQMAEPTAIAFVLASLSMLMLNLRRRPYLVEAGQGLAALVLVIGAAALAGYLLHLEALYRWYLFSRMALHTALGLCLLGAALWLLWRDRLVSFPDARRIVLFSAASLVVVSTLAGLVSAAWFRHEGDSALSRTLEATRESRAALLRAALDLRSERAAIVVSRPQLLTQLRLLATRPGDGAALALARQDVASLRPYGFDSIRIFDGNGRPLISDGDGLGDALPEFPIDIGRPGLASLVWRRGLVLRNRTEIVDGARVLGAVLTEQPLSAFAGLLAPEVGAPAGDQMLLCGYPLGGAEAACFPSDPTASPLPLRGVLAETLGAALAGEQGHRVVDDGRRHNLRVEYGPVGDTGLALAIAVDEAALYAPVRNALSFGFLLVLLISLLGALLMRTRVQPLAERLAAAEGRYATVVKNLREGVYLFDAEGSVIAANDAAGKQMGVTLSALVGRSIHSPWPVFHPDGRPLSREEYPVIRAQQSGEAVIDELLRMRRPSGVMRWVAVSAVPTEVPPGRRERGVLVTVSDVTERYEAEARSRAQEQRFRLMVDNIGDYAILMLDADGHIAIWNPGAQRIEGYAEDEIIGHHHSILYTEEDRAAGKPARALATASETGHYVDEGWRLRKDGERFWASVAISAMRDEHGKLLGYAKVTRDLTTKRRAEQALRDSEAQYRMLVGGVADGVISIDEHGVVYSYSAAAERIFGYPVDQVIGRNVTMLMPERHRIGHDDKVARFARQQDPRLIGMRREVTGQRADGSEFPMMLALNVAPGSGPGRYVALVTDITERKLAERRLAEALRLRDAVLDTAPYGIFSTDTDGIIQTFNHAAEQMFWYGAEEMVGRLDPTVLHDADELAALAAELGRELGTSSPPPFDALVYAARHGDIEPKEFTYLRKGGSRFPVQLALSALRDANGAITGYVGITHDISERKRREEYAQHIAHHDFLTGLPNRLLFSDRLAVAIEHARRSRHKLAVMMLDLDHFKRVNDSLGHHIGDELLKIVTERLRGCVRAADTVARLGGDEFVVLLDELVDPQDAERVAGKIVAAIAQPFLIGSHELQVTTSIGINFFPDDGQTPALLLKNADSAMYRAKSAGRNGCFTFNAEIARAAQERLEMEQALRRALRDHEFRIHYQPQVDFGSGEVIGMEALLRWGEPGQGRLLPDAFIPIAEESGLIVPIGDWVLRTACVEARQIQLRTGRPLRLAVNLSPRQFRQEELVQVVRGALDDSGLPPGDLELEITEGVLMVDSEATIARLAALRALGLRIAIDDFGVGFSSLSYVTRFPIDTLKIDRSFISNLPRKANDAAVVEAILALAASLGIGVVAEGVESAEQIAFLRARDQRLAAGRAMQAQGFCFGAAVPAEAFIAGYAACRARCRALLPHAT